MPNALSSHQLNVIHYVANRDLKACNIEMLLKTFLTFYSLFNPHSTEVFILSSSQHFTEWPEYNWEIHSNEFIQQVDKNVIFRWKMLWPSPLVYECWATCKLFTINSTFSRHSSSNLKINVDKAERKMLMRTLFKMHLKKKNFLVNWIFGISSVQDKFWIVYFLSSSVFVIQLPWIVTFNEWLRQLNRNELKHQYNSCAPYKLYQMEFLRDLGWVDIKKSNRNNN